MEIGKVPNSVLQKIILDKIKYNRTDVLIRPKIGEDCCAIDFGENACVMSTDPITGAANEIGKLAVHVGCNDIASCGVEPLGILITILAPKGTTEQDLDIVMSDICQTSELLNVEILGGHTEITNAVTRFVIITTTVGKVPSNALVKTSGAQPGDRIILTKSAGIEGTAIIAHDKEDELHKNLDSKTIETAKSFINSISVVKEGIIAGKFGVSSMHDVTEGGVLGAVWEVAEASVVGAKIYKDLIPIEEETKIICNYFDIDPLKLISSGCMLITCKDGDKLVNEMLEKGIKATVIGMITKETERIIKSGNGFEEIHQPDSDELYKVVK
jgi:hydrogenase expression/formation protein HypE